MPITSQNLKQINASPLPRSCLLPVQKSSWELVSHGDVLVLPSPSRAGEELLQGQGLSSADSLLSGKCFSCLAAFSCTWSRKRCAVAPGVVWSCLNTCGLCPGLMCLRILLGWWGKQKLFWLWWKPSVKCGCQDCQWGSFHHCTQRTLCTKPQTRAHF